MTSVENFFQYLKYNIYYKIVFNETVQADIGLLYLHGKNVHSGYLEKIIDPAQKIIYFAFDNPGQGKSSGSRGMCDLYKLIPHLIRYFIENIIILYKIRNLYILGESLGSLTGFYFINTIPITCLKITGVIFLPALFRIKESENTGKRIMIALLNSLYPGLLIRNRTDFSFYTNDEKKLKELNRDPYYSHEMTIRLLYGIFRLYDYFKMNIHLINLPVLFVHGKADHYSGKKDLIRTFKQIKNSPCKRIAYFSHSKHWLMISDEIEKIKAKVYKWIACIEKNSE